MQQHRAAFQTEIRAFLKNLLKVFPDDRDLKMISSSLNIALIDDPQDNVVRTFYNTIAPYEQLIKQKDPQFFCECSLRGDVPLLTKLEGYWQHLSAADQKVVWDYMHVLLHLSKNILAAAA